MAPNAALGFLVLGTALILVRTGRRLSFCSGQVLAMLVSLLAFFALAGYSYDATMLSRVPTFIPIGLNTIAPFLALSLGVLCAHPLAGVTATITSKTAGGMLARRLVPAAIIVPVVLGWLRLQGEREGLFETEFGVALMVALTVVFLILNIWNVAGALNRADNARSNAERELRKAHDALDARVQERTKELAQVNHTLRDTNRDLAQKNQENEMFVYSVSHDLRSPLVNLQGFSKELTVVCDEIRELVDREEVPESIRQRLLQLIDLDVQQSVRFIQTGVARLSSIIDALLRLSRAGRVEYQQQQVDVQQTVARVVESVSVTAFELGAEIQTGELPPAWGDVAAIEQVFANLIGNALKYASPQRPCLIEIGHRLAELEEESPESARVYYVKDNGLGIAESYWPKLFQAFKRFHPNAAPGDGMGLAIVRRVVERHGGRIWLESTVGRGTTFYFSLPCVPAGSRSTHRVPLATRTYRDGNQITSNLAGGR
jgi:signal transduction histidine kinase